jgi:uncharacterized protein Yka (UPF0111/DUF47 family)
MDQPVNMKERMREIIALAQRTAKLIREMAGELERQIDEWKRLAERECSTQAPPSPGPTGAGGSPRE